MYYQARVRTGFADAGHYHVAAYSTYTHQKDTPNIPNNPIFILTGAAHVDVLPALLFFELESMSMHKGLGGCIFSSHSFY